PGVALKVETPQLPQERLAVKMRLGWEAWKTGMPGATCLWPLFRYHHVATPSSRLPQIIMRLGDRGPLVVELRKDLNELGAKLRDMVYDTVSKGELTADVMGRVETTIQLLVNDFGDGCRLKVGSPQIKINKNYIC
ncbi:MAG: hypothetical protein ACPLRU_05865, partial [Desulfofundulus sp.]